MTDVSRTAAANGDPGRCRHCRRCRSLPGRRGLCWACWSRPEVRRRYPRRITGGLARPTCVKAPCRHCGRLASVGVLAKRKGLCNRCRNDPALAARYGIGPARVAYEPTAEQIAASCAEVRAGWTAREEERRRVSREPEVRARVVRVLAE